MAVRKKIDTPRRKVWEEGFVLLHNLKRTVNHGGESMAAGNLRGVLFPKVGGVVSTTENGSYYSSVELEGSLRTLSI